MSEMIQFDWVEYYKEFARILLSYRNSRQALIEKIREVFATTAISLPTLEKDNKIVDIDPFTVFGLFNKKLTDSNRISILQAIAELFEVKARVPASFNSIPVLNPQNSTFYYFEGERSENDIDDLWAFYEEALEYAEKPTPENRDILSRSFDKAITKKGNGNSKITMGLFWIAPDSFLNLDQRNTWYIYESGMIPKNVVSSLPKIETKIPASKYFEIVEKLRTYLQSDKSKLKDFKELSFEAWKYSEQVNQENKLGKTQNEKMIKGAAVADDGVEGTHYWLYSPGERASLWDECLNDGIMAIGWDEIGDLRAFSSKDEMKKAMKEKIDPSKVYRNGAHATWQFIHEMKPGDIVFAKKGLHHIIGRGIVESDYIYDSSRSDYNNIRKVCWTHNGEWPHPGQASMKTLTDITSYTDYVKKLNAFFVTETADDAEEIEVEHKPYNQEDFLKEVFIDRDSYANLTALIRNKKNVILQGAPGVGKTFAAKRLAYSMIGEKNPNRVKMVQFHQSYSYEDFIMGFRPSETGFELKRGVFYNFCKDAEIDSENDYFFIIDEINRGNISKIFGELFMLIENDKRGVELQLLYSDELFSIPNNVYIIGMMNTADRSLAMLDYALRRRFAFFEMRPGFDTEGFKDYRKGLKSVKFDRLINCIESLNSAIASDESLGDGFCIGHSYFCNLTEATDQALHGIVEFELIPLLKEYWFDEPVKIKDWSEELRSALK